MIRRFPIYMMLGAMIAMVLPACNKKDDEDPEIKEIEYSSTEIESFALKANDKILTGLDSVFFSIDLNNACVFNADSLPLGTNVSRLILNIGLPSVNEATLIESPDEKGTRKEINYLKNATDSVNFSYGDVTLRIVSYDKKATRNYTIKVNVHKTVPDSLYWNSTAAAQLPASDAYTLTAQKALSAYGKAYSMALTDQGRVVISTSSDPFTGQWETQSTNLPDDTNVATFTATTDAFYVSAGKDGVLYKSTDALSWEPTNTTSVSWIYGGYGTSILYTDATGSIVRYPEMTVTTAPEGFPMSGTGEMITFESIWAEYPTSIMVGGVTADGTYCADTWAYDGNEWARISIVPLPQGVDSPAVFPYFTFRTDKKTWLTTAYTTLVAIGGRKADGSIDNTVYISLDYGIRWKKADELMQLPAAIAPRYGAQALVFNTTMTASRSSVWREYSSIPLSPWWQLATTPITCSRATSPINEWECPYIYLIGGYNADGKLYPQIWRGVINRLTFKPLQ